MRIDTRLERKKKINFAVGMAAIDGGKPTEFTQKLLKQYENGQVTTGELKKEILKKYAQAFN